VGKTPTISWGFARYEYDGEILGCSGKHWVPDPVLFGAVGIPNQKYNFLTLFCFVCMFGEKEREGESWAFGWHWQRARRKAKEF
jgi:hypothetical protein